MKKVNDFIGNKKGITLIALVIIIAILVILGGVSIALIVNDNSIISKAKEQQIEQTKAEILQELELAKVPIMIDGKGYTDLGKYLQYIQTEGLNTHKVTDVEYIEGEVNSTIIVDNEYVYTAAQIENNVIINAVGNVRILKPDIETAVVTEANTNNIKIQINVRRSTECEFWIAETGSENYKKDGTKKINNKITNDKEFIEYTYENLKKLEEGKTYTLKVIAKNKNGEVEKTLLGELQEIPLATGAYGIPVEWTTGEVTVTLPVQEGYTTVYQIEPLDKENADAWLTYDKENKPTVEENKKVYYAFSDGVNFGTFGTITISNIDTIAPTIGTELNATGVSTKGFTLNVGVTDTLSGLGKIVWKYKLSSASTYTTKEVVYTALNGTTTGTKTAVIKSETFTGLTSGKYDVAVDVYDVAGNMTTSTTIVTTETIGDLGEASAIPTSWTSGNVIVTLPESSTSGVKTQYKLGSTGTWEEYDSTNKLSIETNTKVYYRYTDETNTTKEEKYGTITISNIDTVEPTISTALNATGISTKGFTLNVGVTDTLSGLGKIVWKYKLSSASTYTTKEVVYTALNGTTAGTKTAVTKSETFTGLTSGKYDVAVDVYDVAGKMATSTTTVTTGTIDFPPDTASVNPKYWTTGTVTVTLPVSSTSGVTTQYREGTTGTWQTYNSTNKLPVTSNKTIYYRYTDGTNTTVQGSYGSIEVSNIDTVAPTISTELNATGVTTSGFTLNVGVTDTLSGLGKIVWKYKLSSASTYTTKEVVYTALNGTTAGTKTAVTKSETFTGLTNGTYDVAVNVYDVAGKMTTSTTTITTIGTSWSYNYTGNVQTFTAPTSGMYEIALYGAQGGNLSTSLIGAKGSYVTGKIFLNKNDTLNIYVGGQNGYNGGGAASDSEAVGGGATDIRIKGTDIANRIMVAAGGGGAYKIPVYHTHTAETGACYKHITSETKYCGAWRLAYTKDDGEQIFACKSCGTEKRESAGNGSGDGHYKTVKVDYYSLICTKKPGVTIDKYTSSNGNAIESSNGTLYNGSTSGGGGYYGGTTGYAGTNYTSEEYLSETSVTEGERSGNGYAQIIFSSFKCSGKTYYCEPPKVTKQCSGGYTTYYFNCSTCFTNVSSLSNNLSGTSCSNRSCSGKYSLNMVYTNKCSHDEYNPHTYEGYGKCTHGKTSVHYYCKHNSNGVAHDIK